MCEDPREEVWHCDRCAAPKLLHYSYKLGVVSGRPCDYSDILSSLSPALLPFPFRVLTFQLRISGLKLCL